MSTTREKLAIVGIMIFILIGTIMMQSDGEERIIGVVCYAGATAVWRFMLRGGQIGRSIEDGADAPR